MAPAVAANVPIPAGAELYAKVSLIFFGMVALLINIALKGSGGWNKGSMVRKKPRMLDMRYNLLIDALVYLKGNFERGSERLSISRRESRTPPSGVLDLLTLFHSTFIHTLQFTTLLSH